jgi:hypothetical protein
MDNDEVKDQNALDPNSINIHIIILNNYISSDCFSKFYTCRIRL